MYTNHWTNHWTNSYSVNQTGQGISVPCGVSHSYQTTSRNPYLSEFTHCPTCYNCGHHSAQHANADYFARLKQHEDLKRLEELSRWSKSHAYY